MADATDQDLIRAYARTRNEDAFAELTRQHVDLVYFTALRILRAPALAEEVTQRVFLALAKDVVKLKQRISLSGWLHETARNHAINTVRGEERRRAREKEAATMNSLEAKDSSGLWEQVAPELHEALTQLSEADRELLLWRYFERKTAEEIGERLGLKADAAQKRLGRALERLREVLAGRKVSASATSLAAALAVQAAQSAAAGLAATAIAAVSASSSFLPMTPAIQILMTSTKAKIGLAAALALGVATPVVLQHQHNNRLEAEIQALRAQLENAPPSQSASGVDTAELERLRQEHNELMRLRAEVNQLRAERDALKATAGGPASKAKSEKPMDDESKALLARAPEIPMITSNKWANVGLATAAAALQTMNWAVIHRDTNAYLAALNMEPGASKDLEEAFGLLPKAVHEKYKSVDELLIDWQLNLVQPPTGFRILSETPNGADGVTLEVQAQFGDGRVGGGTTRFVQDDKGWHQVVSVPTRALAGIANELLGLPNPNKGVPLPIGEP